MHRLPVQPQRSALAWLLLPLVAWAANSLPVAEQKPQQNTESSTGQFVFSLVPKAFQKNPLVDQTVITEMTEEGKKLPPPSRENPAYYVAEPGGFHVEGHSPGDEQPPAADLERSMKQALAINGYQPSSPGHPPSLLIIYYWGSHNNLDQGSAEVPSTAFTDAGHKNLLSRAALVGGNKFAGELKKALELQDRQREMAAAAPPEYNGMMSAFGPLQRFTERDPKTRQLYEESKADCYYVVASAYDYLAAARGQRILLWRSKMTVDAQGVSMTDTLPGLILNAGTYFGRDMPEPATITKRVSREGQVRLGPLEVKDYFEKADAPAPEKTPAHSPKEEHKP